MAGAGAALWPWQGLFAQGGAALLRTPKQALVIGNSKYRQVPLKNPLNDARGMADALKSAGFGVNLGLELTQAGIREAIRAHSDNLARTKAVGLFYFAGHGAQLAWRNYLIPVDAEIVNVEELRERCVDLNSLIEGIKRAGNPMNLIILVHSAQGAEKAGGRGNRAEVQAGARGLGADPDRHTARTV